MEINELKKNWEEFGEKDPLWSILTWSGKEDNKWNLKDFFNEGKKEVKQVMEYINSLNIEINWDTALDFGCGVGRLSVPLAHYFKKVIGVDISGPMIQLARQYSSEKNNCEYIVNQNTNLNIFQDNSFDLVFSVITLQHMEPRYSTQYLREFHRILKPGGVLFFQLPSEPVNTKPGAIIKIKRIIKLLLPTKLFGLYKKIRYGNTPVMEMYGIKNNEVIDFLNKNGYAVIDALQNTYAGDNWISYQYCAKKKA